MKEKQSLHPSSAVVEEQPQMVRLAISKERAPELFFREANKAQQAL